MPAHSEHFTSGDRPIEVEVFVPTASGRRPAVLVLHGLFGLMPQYRPGIVSFAEALANKGIAAAIPHYLERTDTAPGPDAGMVMHKRLPEWKAACGDALVYLRDRFGVDAGRLGALGFSLGGHLALGLGMSPPTGTNPKCVVDFFGPTSDPPLGGDRAALPPVLIHHGTDDKLVPFADSVSLVGELRAAGKTEGLGYQFIPYKGQGHGFTGPDLDRSRTATVEFFAGVL
jgi:dienelactone hydrolase